MTEAYYYHRMSREEQMAYRAMKEGLTAMAVSFPVPRLPQKQLTDLFFKLRLDCPDIFYAAGFGYRYYQDSTNVEMIPEYLFEKNKIKVQQQAMSARITKLTRPARDLDDWEKERYIHDFICENVTYDKLKKAYSHEIIGPLGQGVGVCEGIAKSVKILCDALGIWCIIAISEANPEKKIKYRHAWNILRLGGSYYHLDATFDNSLSRTAAGIRYDYFNLDDKRLFRDHEPALYPVPACEDAGQAYYIAKKLSFTKPEDVGKRAQQAIRKKKCLTFHWRGGALNREKLSEIIRCLEEAAQGKGLHVQISLNRLQAVFSVRFLDCLPGQELIIEEANEGEA